MNPIFFSLALFLSHASLAGDGVPECKSASACPAFNECSKNANEKVNEQHSEREKIKKSGGNKTGREAGAAAGGTKREQTDTHSGAGSAANSCEQQAAASNSALEKIKDELDAIGKDLEEAIGKANKCPDQQADMAYVKRMAEDESAATASELAGGKKAQAVCANQKNTNADRKGKYGNAGSQNGGGAPQGGDQAKKDDGKGGGSSGGGSPPPPPQPKEEDPAAAEAKRKAAEAEAKKKAEEAEKKKEEEEAARKAAERGNRPNTSGQLPTGSAPPSKK